MLNIYEVIIGFSESLTFKFARVPPACLRCGIWPRCKSSIPIRSELCICMSLIINSLSIRVNHLSIHFTILQWHLHIPYVIYMNHINVLHGSVNRVNVFEISELLLYIPATRLWNTSCCINLTSSDHLFMLIWISILPSFKFLNRWVGWVVFKEIANVAKVYFKSLFTGQCIAVLGKLIKWVIPELVKGV